MSYETVALLFRETEIIKDALIFIIGDLVILKVNRKRDSLRRLKEKPAIPQG